MSSAEVIRPIISEYKEPSLFVRDMIQYRKQTEPHFSVLQAARGLRRLSPTLVSLIVQGKRKITLDRVEELSKLLRLTSHEKYYLRDWVDAKERPAFIENEPSSLSRGRKEVSTHILNDWINVYVKDCFQIREVQKNPELAVPMLANIASPKRIEKAMIFLLREGHLRRTPEGHIVVETNLTVTDPKVSSKKIRQFHKGALGVAREALDLFQTHERFANTLLVPLDEKQYQELLELLQEFAAKLQNFASHIKEGDRLYQLTLNVSPTGGKPK